MAGSPRFLQAWTIKKTAVGKTVSYTIQGGNATVPCEKSILSRHTLVCTQTGNKKVSNTIPGYDEKQIWEKELVAP